MMLTQVNLRTSDAKALLERGTEREKVDAAGELSLLAQKFATPEKRLAAIDARADATGAVSQWFAEEIFNLNLLPEPWITHA